MEWEQAGKQQIQCRQNSVAFNSNVFGDAESPSQGFSKAGNHREGKREQEDSISRTKASIINNESRKRG